MFLWLRSNTVLNSSPLLFLTLSLLFLPLTLTTISFVYDDVIKTLTPYDVIKTLTIVIPTFTAATSLIIIHTTRPHVALISTVKSLPPLFTTIITQTALLLLPTLVIAFSPFALIELLGLGLGFDFDVGVVMLGNVLGFRLPVIVLELIYALLLSESERRLVEFRGRLFFMVVFGVFRFGPLLLWMNVVAKDSTYVAHFDDWVLVVNRCVVYLLFSLVITQYVVMYTLLYLQRRGKGEQTDRMNQT